MEKSENVTDIKEEFDDAQNFHVFIKSLKIFGSIKIFLGMTEFLAKLRNHKKL